MHVEHLNSPLIATVVFLLTATALAAVKLESSSSRGYGDICEQLPRHGPCHANLERWFYNMSSKRCERFMFGGCGGNGNNFKTFEECRNFCRDLPMVTSNETETLKDVDKYFYFQHVGCSNSEKTKLQKCYREFLTIFDKPPVEASPFDFAKMVDSLLYYGNYDKTCKAFRKYSKCSKRALQSTTCFHYGHKILTAAFSYVCQRKNLNQVKDFAECLRGRYNNEGFVRCRQKYHKELARIVQMLKFHSKEQEDVLFCYTLQEMLSCIRPYVEPTCSEQVWQWHQELAEKISLAVNITCHVRISPLIHLSLLDIIREAAAPYSHPKAVTKQDRAKAADKSKPEKKKTEDQDLYHGANIKDIQPFEAMLEQLMGNMGIVNDSTGSTETANISSSANETVGESRLVGGPITEVTTTVRSSTRTAKHQSRTERPLIKDVKENRINETLLLDEMKEAGKVVKLASDRGTKTSATPPARITKKATGLKNKLLTPTVTKSHVTAIDKSQTATLSKKASTVAPHRPLHKPTSVTPTSEETAWTSTEVDGEFETEERQNKKTASVTDKHSSMTPNIITTRTPLKVTSSKPGSTISRPPMASVTTLSSSVAFGAEVIGIRLEEPALEAEEKSHETLAPLPNVPVSTKPAQWSTLNHTEESKSETPSMTYEESDSKVTLTQTGKSIEISNHTVTYRPLKMEVIVEDYESFEGPVQIANKRKDFLEKVTTSTLPSSVAIEKEPEEPLAAKAKPHSRLEIPDLVTRPQTTISTSLSIAEDLVAPTSMVEDETKADTMEKAAESKEASVELQIGGSPTEDFTSTAIFIKTAETYGNQTIPPVIEEAHGAVTETSADETTSSATTIASIEVTEPITDLVKLANHWKVCAKSFMLATSFLTEYEDIDAFLNSRKVNILDLCQYYYNYEACMSLLSATNEAKQQLTGHYAILGLVGSLCDHDMVEAIHKHGRCIATYLANQTDITNCLQTFMHFFRTSTESAIMQDGACDNLDSIRSCLSHLNCTACEPGAADMLARLQGGYLTTTSMLCYKPHASLRVSKSLNFKESSDYFLYANPVSKEAVTEKLPRSDCLTKINEMRQAGEKEQWLPQCDENGDYVQKQCDDLAGECWCVDVLSGEELAYSRVEGNAHHVRCGTCHKEQKRMQDEGSSFIPSCDSFGFFEPLQCDYALEQCWCVNTTSGDEKEGTRVNAGEKLPTCELANVIYCQQLPVKQRCKPDGSKPLSVLRWYKDADGCKPYTTTFCPSESHLPPFSFRFQSDCETLCLNVEHRGV